MLIFIDDSGDPGFKINKGASAFFVIACVIFKDELEAEKSAVALKQFRRKLKFPDTVEFKFNKSRRSIRESFLKILRPFEFDIRCIVVDKKLIRSDELINSQQSFCNYFVKLLLEHNRGTIRNAKVRLDGRGDRLFKRNITTYLRRELNQPAKKVVKNLQLVDSKNNILIQMADMVAGAIHRSYDKEKTDASVYRKIINKKIKDCWEFK
ncbi:hypothetical protein A3F34_03130 [Candidatus Roizmanbacteria bacterium RIFCSPHIGHO2_12_FULL_44_10]|uniref:DUF3800 domain-containing protein n=1 Tax=Candidatus Roizmanbacteria bacterium RIFCSPHIGHO2_12_FULL_44_10 TaxID=1802054 RepID=A0A1F7IAR3_9BACT|nr:MAG: hypothetical protein A3F34_03130 [Candidatus Roizmanbacteria bacterium RIFCSPHIGHO2_12_FULL_44_10]